MFVLCALVGLLAPAHSRPSVADLPGVEDPREGPPLVLDVARVRAARPTGITGREIAFRVHTYAPFTNADLDQADGEEYAVAIGISTDADDAFERLCYVHVRGDHGDQDGLTPYGVVTRGKRIPEADLNPFSSRERFLGYALVRRPEATSLEVTIPTTVLGLPPSRRFRWQARIVSSPGSGSVYYDYVPDDGLARGHGRK